MNKRDFYVKNDVPGGGNHLLGHCIAQNGPQRGGDIRPPQYGGDPSTLPPFVSLQKVQVSCQPDAMSFIKSEIATWWKRSKRWQSVSLESPHRLRLCNLPGLPTSTVESLELPPESFDTIDQFACEESDVWSPHGFDSP